LRKTLPPIQDFLGIDDENPDGLGQKKGGRKRKRLKTATPGGIEANTNRSEGKNSNEGLLQFPERATEGGGIEGEKSTGKEGGCEPGKDLIKCQRKRQCREKAPKTKSDDPASWRLTPRGLVGDEVRGETKKQIPHNEVTGRRLKDDFCLPHETREVWGQTSKRRP